jgi:2-polyprenyl-3-methyl-5-hydroxy-6-metoxy-1,4-benzoquinol methylase
MIHYDNPFHADNVYGHVVSLVQRYAGGRPGDVHLDIGCGFARMAEPLRDMVKLSYIGYDINAEAVKSLRQRGFEADQLDLHRPAAEIVAQIDAALAGRKVASISIVDVLEHLAHHEPLMQAVRELARRFDAVVVVSVPNFAHRDVGFKLAFGRLDTRKEGLLDHTHLHTFTETGLQAFLLEHGLHVVERNDVVLERSDQFFPATHPALSPATLLGSMMRTLRASVDDMSSVNQLVAACLPGPKGTPQHLLTESALQDRRPFLSVVTRTQGRRHTCLRDVLLSLTAQSCDDFELIVVGHRLDLQAQLLVERLIEDTPEHLRERIRLIRVERGNRTAPLNEGFAASRGRYVAILDDDDVPMAHWVEHFKTLEEKAPGCVLRAVAVKQECDEARTAFGAVTAPLTVSGFINEFPCKFDWLQHLRVNQTPPIALAFPRAAFHDLNIRFDESLTTTEDWDFLMRMAAVCGVASSPRVTCIYRWWKGAESSRSVHAQDEWRSNHERIWNKLDQQPTLLAPGTTRQLRDLMDHHDKLLQMLTELKAERGLLPADAALRGELEQLLQSTSWRLSAPLRGCLRMLKGAPKPHFDPARMPLNAVEETIRNIRASISWKVTAPLRMIRDLVCPRSQERCLTR